VGVLEARGDGDLALEPLDADPRRQLGPQDLHHDLAAERDLLGHEDMAHASATEFALDAVGAAERRLKPC
jgi:hypothetical protein